ncbi:hypothetical protein Pelo_9872 [Pelomyxa schiedti]|nr:hypothetical protein Pelo_9872 [Pelomyxa schiedti]
MCTSCVSGNPLSFSNCPCHLAANLRASLSTSLVICDAYTKPLVQHQLSFPSILSVLLAAPLSSCESSLFYDHHLAASYRTHGGGRRVYIQFLGPHWTDMQTALACPIESLSLPITLWPVWRCVMMLYLEESVNFINKVPHDGRSRSQQIFLLLWLHQRRNILISFTGKLFATPLLLDRFWYFWQITQQMTDVHLPDHSQVRSLLWNNSRTHCLSVELTSFPSMS